RKPFPVNINRRHQIEAEQREIGQVVLGQIFTREVGVQAAEAAKSVRAYANTLKVGPDDPAGAADDD
ncbi:MAG TPA: hypothetical protein VFV34_27625, partial [Blastocatellia bacterium]|nr:hypothetical protein [Blastocatellia bacterium]